MASFIIKRMLLDIKQSYIADDDCCARYFLSVKSFYCCPGFSARRSSSGDRWSAIPSFFFRLLCHFFFSFFTRRALLPQRHHSKYCYHAQAISFYTLFKCCGKTFRHAASIVIITASDLNYSIRHKGRTPHMRSQIF